MLKLYANIRACRKAAKMTQEELAHRTGYTDRSSIARIEKGEIDLSQSKIVQFAEALGTTPARLMGWEEKPAADLQDMGALAAQVLLDQDAAEMVRAYMAMGDSDRQAVREFMALSEADRYALQLVMASMGKKTAGAEAPAGEVSVVDVE